MIDAKIAEQVVAAIRSQLAALGPGAVAALDEPECHAAVTGFANACKGIETRAHAWNGKAPETQALIDALHDYLRALDTIVHEARRVGLEHTRTGIAQAGRVASNRTAGASITGAKALYPRYSV